MNPAGRLCLALLLPVAAGTVQAQEPVSLQRQDQTTIAVMAYAPEAGACRGVAVVSPGAGGSETGYSYLGEALAGLNYLAVVVGHPESGRRALREKMRGNSLREGLAALITEPDAYRGRFMDMTAARQWAQGRCQGTDTVLVGHSMGAATALMEAGARNKLGLSGAQAFGAYIALSPQGAGSIFPANAWSDLQRPVLSITGTRDDELGGGSWLTRTEPYRNMPPGCKWLAVIDGATHMNLAGNGMARNTQDLTTQVIGDFLDGVQRGNCRAPRAYSGMAIESK
jgi:predicted dienelactone hydrolase